MLLETKGLSDKLQSPKLDYLKAADLIKSLIEELEEYRSEQKATDYFEKSLGIATKRFKLLPKYIGTSEKRT